MIGESLRLIENRHHAFAGIERLKQNVEGLDRGPAILGGPRDSELAQDFPQRTIEAHPRIWHVRRAHALVLAHHQRAREGALAGSGFSDQQCEAARLMRETPFQCRQRFGMRRAREKRPRRGVEAEGWTAQAEVFVVGHNCGWSRRIAMVSRLATSAIVTGEKIRSSCRSSR